MGEVHKQKYIFNNKVSFRNIDLITVGSKPRITVPRLLKNVVSHRKSVECNIWQLTAR